MEALLSAESETEAQERYFSAQIEENTKVLLQKKTKKEPLTLKYLKETKISIEQSGIVPIENQLVENQLTEVFWRIL